jgi:hypothetical protein
MPLWLDMVFLAVPGERPAPEIVAALPVAARLTGRGPARLALAETLHSFNEENETRFAIISVRGHTLIAPPGADVTAKHRAWPEALSRRFGRCYAISTDAGMGSVARFDDGVCTARVSDFEAPAEPLLGLSGVIKDEEAEPLSALARLLGVGDLGPLLRDPGLFAEFGEIIKE